MSTKIPNGYPPCRLKCLNAARHLLLHLRAKICSSLISCFQCFRAYTGPSFLGLAEPDAKSCIAECDKVNHGFSLLECYGVTWLKYAGDAASVRCLLKTRGGLLNFTTDTLALSAVLLDDVPQPITGAFNPPPKEINGTWYPS